MKYTKIKGTLTAAAWLTLALFIVLISVYVRVRLLNLPLERDEGEFAYIGQLLLKGIPPFAHAYSLKLPGTFGVYALLMTLFGQTASGIHIGFLLVNLATVLLIFLIGKRVYDLPTGAVAAAVYALLSVSQAVYGVVAHATHFVVLFSLAGFLCLLTALDRHRLPLALVSGLFFGLSFTMKQHAAPIALFALCFLVWRNWREGVSFRHLFAVALLFGCGFALPYLGWAIYLGLQGVFGVFWFWTVQYASQYATNTTLFEGLHLLAVHGGRMIKTTGLFWLVAMFQFALLLLGRGRFEERFFVIGLLVSSFIAVLPGYYFRPHYFVMMLPAVALLVGSAVTWPFQKDLRYMPLFAKAMAVGVVVIACAATLIQERNYLFNLSPAQVSRTIYLANPFPESPAIAAYLRHNTTPDDRIAVLGSEPQIFFYADRFSATGHLCMYGLMEEQPFAKRMQEELIREVEAAHPKYIVLVNVLGSWLPRPRSHRTIFDWSAAYLSQWYEVDGVVDLIDPQTTWMWWGPEAQNHPPQARNYLLIYRRKE